MRFHSYGQFLAYRHVVTSYARTNVIGLVHNSFGKSAPETHFASEDKSIYKSTGLKSDSSFHIHVRSVNCVFLMRFERCLVALLMERNVGQSRGGLLCDLIAKQTMFTKYQNYKS